MASSERDDAPHSANGVPRRLMADAESFVGREWLIGDVHTWLHDPASRLYLLTGDPGTGKSMISSWLAGAGPTPNDPVAAQALAEIRRSWWAVQFCGRRWDGASTDPRAFTRSLAAQLADADDAFAAAALKTLPGSVDVSISVAHNHGEVVGIRTQQLWLAGMSTPEGFGVAVKEPLRVLYATHPRKPVALLVDGLDETIGEGVPSILDLVASLRDVPSTVKIFASSKRDRRVRHSLDGFGRVSVLDLSSTEIGARQAVDLRAYVQRRAARAASTLAETSSRWSLPDIVSAAAGNFQYVRLWFDDLDAGVEPESAELPRGLPDLYRAHLDRLMPQRSGYGTSYSWLRHYQPLLGLLAVAQGPVPVSTVARIVGWSESRVLAGVDDLQQVIDVEVTGDEFRLRFFHTSVADFLLRSTLDGTQANPYYIDGAEFHSIVVEHYYAWQQKNDGSWHDCDDYGLRHLPAHLVSVVTWRRRSPAARVHELLSASDFAESQRKRFGSSDQTARAYRLGLDIALSEADIDVARELIQAMIGSGDRTILGAVSGALEQLHSHQPSLAEDNIIGLLKQTNPDAVRVGLNAANAIGYGAAGLFRWIAQSSSEDVRKQAAFTAYVRWMHGERDTVIGFLRDLTSAVRLWSPVRALRALRFQMDVTIALYTSQCHDRELATALSDVWREILVERLHLDRINGPMVQRVYQRASTASSLSDRVLEAMLLSDLEDPQTFFGAERAEREAFLRGVSLLEADADLPGRACEVARLLNSSILLLRLLGALVTGTHARRDLSHATAAMAQAMAGLSGRGRLWHLIGFTSMVPTGPPWLTHVRRLTEDLFSRDLDVVRSRDHGTLASFNIVLLPLGLAAGPAAAPLTTAEAVLAAAFREGDVALATSVVSSLGFVGLYYPESSLASLQQAASAMSPDVDAELVRTLALIYVIHPRSVDVFLVETGRDDLTHRVRAAADVRWTRRHFDRIGHFNNAVNQAARHPVMRRELLIPALMKIGRARVEGEYLARPSGVLNLLRTCDYDLLRLTVEDDGPMV